MTKYSHKIENAVALRGSISVGELSDLLGVSDQTIRRVVKPLVDEGKVIKVHGAIVSTERLADPPFHARMQIMRAEKTAIAARVVAQIADGASLAIDTGSTSGFIAQALQIRKNLVVVTNSAYVASTLATVPGNRVYMAGSQLRDHDGAAFDRLAFTTIERMRADHCILSASSVDPARGFLTYEQCEADIVEAMQGISDRTIMAVDHSKFRPTQKPGMVAMMTLKAQSRVVTDKAPASDYAGLLKPFKVEVA
ncbi:DeoR/GlpR family DNA-binding transcription regulator [Aestuariivirga litoralis]|uniref:DeoR/GlpR family DNA-binding transcription regulator n=1 Tax=Aestuariivirga litoralis TaxID=2650924 RepID=UPI0018C6231B|nr:DeoR/GlpR family DNA-binding transcription regulator [Aestuariivirga litoralis]MBG1233246.1 DeoR/GlpR transcriptional regulator [Aestuariivirga litoralis]